MNTVGSGAIRGVNLQKRRVRRPIGLGEERRSDLAEQSGGGASGRRPAGHGSSLTTWQGIRRLRGLLRHDGNRSAKLP
jgi:hypothetical protein